MRSSPPLPGPAADLAPRLRDALGLLLVARGYAQELQLDVWDFAVELCSLQAAGLTTSDLRWLACKGYVEHAAETTPPEKDHREFRRLGQLSLAQQTCFVLTERGTAVAQLADHPAMTRGNGNGHEVPVNGKSAPRAERPSWDADLRELRVGEAIVKRFRVPAPNQELILAAFEEEGWPVQIDDPLSPKWDLDPKRRLHDAINRLNRNQRQQLIHFLGNGDGRGLRWELVR